jgi:hypothetical protein
MELIAKVMLTALVAVNVTTSEAQQPPERSGQNRPAGVGSGAMPMPRSGFAGDVNHSLEAQRPAWEAYQRCVRENEQAFRLSSITRSLIEIRNGKDRYIALLNDPNTPARFKQKSYDESIAEGMSEYWRLGGTTRSIEEITPLPNPCADVQPGPKPPPNRADRESKSSITATTSVTPVPTEVRSEVRAAQGLPVIGTSNGAKWSKIDESFASTLYIDPSSIKKVPKTEKSEKDEDIRQATEMIDFKIKAADGPSSYISNGEYDCKSGKTRYRSGNAYAGPAGTGRILNAITPSDWSPQPSKSPAPLILKYVCSKDSSANTKADVLPNTYQHPSATLKGKPEAAFDEGACVIKPVMTNVEMAKCR